MSMIKTDSIHYEKIAAKIREKTNGTDSYKPADMASGVDAVYEAGKQAEYDAFWDAIQGNGARTNYSRAFAEWSIEYIRPKYKVVPTHVTAFTSTFEQCRQLKKVESQYFDFSQKEQGTSSQGYYYTFNACVNLEEIEDIGLVGGHQYTRTFAYCGKLKKIAKITSNEDTVFSSAFYECKSLEDLTIEGVIGKDFDVHYSPLTKASIESIMEHLSPTETFTVTFSQEAVNNAFTTDEWQAVIDAKPANVTLSLV